MLTFLAILPISNFRNSLWPEVLLTVSRKWIYILELTVGFETNFLNNAMRKTKKYKDLARRQQIQCKIYQPLYMHLRSLLSSLT